MRLLAIAILSVFCGCAVVNSPNLASEPGFNIDASKDLRVLEGLLAAQAAKYERAMEIFYALYQKEKNAAYLKETLKIAVMIGDPRAEELVQIAKNSDFYDAQTQRAIIAYDAYNLGLVDAAKKRALNLVKKDGRDAQNHLILAYIYIYAGEFNPALKEFKIAYKLDPSEENLLKLVDILVNKFQKIDESRKLMYEWAGENSCSKPVCEGLLRTYNYKNASQKMIEIYVKLYEKYGDEKYLKNAVWLYIDKNDKRGAQALLEKFDSYDPLLIMLYGEAKNYDKAIEIARKNYENSQDPRFLAHEAVYRYEKNPSNSDEIRAVAEIFESIVDKLNNATYYNYYGYLLINHDIDAQKGLNLVKKANELEPNSPYIIDSLAWGYYKIGECEKARAWFGKIKNDAQFMRSKEAILHKKSIQKCEKRTKK